jgi:hypothetical protein
MESCPSQAEELVRIETRRPARQRACDRLRAPINKAALARTRPGVPPTPDEGTDRSGRWRTDRLDDLRHREVQV